MDTVREGTRKLFSVLVRLRFVQAVLDDVSTSSYAWYDCSTIVKEAGRLVGKCAVSIALSFGCN